MDPSYEDEKRRRKHYEMLYYMADSDEGIPKGCPCGGEIVVVDTTETESGPGKKYFICNKFEDNELHRKKNWFDGVEQEIGILNKEVDSQKSKIGRLELQIEQLFKEIKTLNEKLQ